MTLNNFLGSFVIGLKPKISPIVLQLTAIIMICIYFEVIVGIFLENVWTFANIQNISTAVNINPNTFAINV